MSILGRFKTISEEEKKTAVESLIKHSTPDFDFFFMIALSVLMATFGLLAGSETVVIGSMLLAPILYPVLGLALGVSMSDDKLIRRAGSTIVQAGALAVVVSALTTALFSFDGFASSWNTSILSRTDPSLLFLMVGIISGLAVTYAMVRPSLSETLPGVAVAVSLIPPLAVVGVGVARFELSVIGGALILFVVNVLGIVAASSLTFSLMNIRSGHKVAQTTMKKEDKRVEKEAAEVAEASEER